MFKGFVLRFMGVSGTCLNHKENPRMNEELTLLKINEFRQLFPDIPIMVPHQMFSSNAGGDKNNQKIVRSPFDK